MNELIKTIKNFSVNNKVNQAADLLAVEIARLKSELEKRPEVVRCGECEYYENCELYHKTMCLRHVWSADKNDFCSHGKRREGGE